MLAGVLAALGLDLLAASSDGGRASGLVIVAAGFLAGVDLVWLAEEFVDGATCLREADARVCLERAAETLHRRGIDPEPYRRLAHAEPARTGV